MNDQVDGLPPPEQGDDAAPMSTLLLIGGLVFAALAFVVAGLGFVLGWWGPGAQPEPVAQAEVVEAAAETGEPDPVALPGAELMPTVEARTSPRATQTVDPLAGAEPVPEIPPPRGRNPSSTRDSETVTKAPEAPWKPAGLIDLQLGTRYRVTLFDPPLAKLEVVE